VAVEAAGGGPDIGAAGGGSVRDGRADPEALATRARRTATRTRAVVGGEAFN
jgi:hypothetical protein